MRFGTVSLRERLGAMFQVDGPPWRVALALAVGVFLGCTPFYGLQTVLAFLIATLFRLSRAVTITGTWLNLPWFAPFVYTAAFEIGVRIVPASQASPGAALAILMGRPGTLSLTRLAQALGDLSLVLLVGTTVVGLAAAGLAYAVAFAILCRRSRDDRQAAPGRRAA